ncbi:MAG: DUF190 domain-containing protein [Thermoplasmatota archaeon]
MSLNVDEPAKRITIYLGESDRSGQEPLYKAIVRFLRARGLWGATVTRGLMGFGKKNSIHTARIEVLSTDLPIVIEAVDSAAKIEGVLAELSTMVVDGLITVEDVTVVRRMPDSPPQGNPSQSG